MSLRYLGKYEPRKLCLFSHAGYSPRPPTLSDRNEVLHGDWSSENQWSGFGAMWGMESWPLPLIWPHQWEMANFDHTQLQNCLIDFDEIQTSELTP